MVSEVAGIYIRQWLRLWMGREGKGMYLMMWPGCLSALIRGDTVQWSSSLDVQKGWVSGTARQMKARQAQYCESQP